jgi:hypothetical protein
LTDLMRTLAKALGPAIDAAREVLRDLDPDDVPAKLRKVAGSSARSLPPPLTKALVREIDENEWFRGKVLETFENGGAGDEISNAFLRREQGWWLTVTAATAESMTAAASQRAAANAEKISRLEQRLDVEKRRVRDARHRAEQAEATLERAPSADADALRNSLDSERRKRAVAEAARDAIEQRARTVEHELAAAQAETARLLRQVLALKKERADLLRRLESGRSDSVPKDAAGLGRYLDRLAAAIDPYRDRGEPAPSPPGGGEAVFRLPAGINPDTAAAIEALATSPAPLVVIVDGYNVLGSIDAASMATSGARRDLLGLLGRLLRFLGRGRVVAVFDSALGDGRASVKGDAGVEVRFTSAGLIADDLIVEMADELGRGTVVISDASEVRERREEHGAVVLWSQALIAWSAP